ncbi:MAG: helix-turn-helix transcriptional regulator [Ferruginibacter sp.]|nr:helix-turn-helix transcriptional regulator [Ferruginibacter sp.]
MLNYYQYLPLSDEDENWGLSVLNTGCTSVPKNQQYPYKHHPAHHYFNWNNGRILNEYQLIYIAGGEGLFESSSMPEKKVTEGAVMILFPGEWHRFKPDTATGWDEYWVGFKGDIINNLVKKNFFVPEEALLQIGLKEAMIILFTEIIEQTKSEKTGYQPLISGAVLHLLGYIHSMVKQKIFENENLVEFTVNKARILLRTRIDEDIAMQKIAEELKVSYAWFRKMFKLYTGIAPQQYFIQLKIEKAKMLLSNPVKSIKEVAYELNFDSPFYFSKLFKEKVGMSPDQYKKKYMTDT